MTNENPDNKYSSVVNYNDKLRYIDFYNKHSIIPVTQNINDQDFIYKRNSLYKMLGLPLSVFRDRTIIEFGPGGGYNAVATTSCNPNNIVFVDASSQSLNEINIKKNKGLYNAKDISIVNSNIFDYSDTKLYDFVIIEGVIQGQTKPAAMLKHVASFVKEGGFLITTATTSTSMLSDICRRLFLPYLLDKHTGFEEQIDAAEKIFESHLKSLNTNTRPVRDWVIDNIFYDWMTHGRVGLFSIQDSIDALLGDFEFFGSSPNFLIDDRFYKNIDRFAYDNNELANIQLPYLNVFLLDYRLKWNNNIKIQNIHEVACLCDILFDLHVSILSNNKYGSDIELFNNKLIELCELLPDDFNITKNSIVDFIVGFKKLLNNENNVQFNSFKHWWGRGQQYVSFIRNGYILNNRESN